MNNLAAWRNLLVFGVCVPLALLLGYLLSEPLALNTMAVMFMVLGVLCVPLLMKWYHPLLVFSLNAAFVFMFLPGSPPLWMVMVAIGSVFMVINRCLDSQRRLMIGGSVPWALLCLAVVVLGTAFATGGVGIRSLGSSTYGGKKYIFIFASIVAYFVLTSQRVPKARAGLYSGLFFLPGATSFIADLAYMAGGAFYWIYYFISAETAFGQAVEESDPYSHGMVRITGWVSVSTAVCLFMLARYGLRGILDLAKPWRLALIVLCFVAGLFGGFRSFVGNLVVVFGVVFFLEGLHRTRYLFTVIFLGLICAVGLVAFSSKMPLTFQRALSFLPIEVDPVAKMDARGSWDWRVGMWKHLLPEVPRYLLKGKGYVLDPSELALTQENTRRGFGSSADAFAFAGDYHNGPLSVLIPFGLWGALAFYWFMFVAGRQLYRNCACDDPTLRRINHALFACFLSRALFHVFLVGGLSADLPGLVFWVGFGISLNAVAKERVESRSWEVAAQPAAV